MTYALTCSCGHTMSVEADSREEGVAKMKAMMTEAALAQHLKAYHKPGEPTPTLAQAHAQIEQNLREA